jgi:hypothetical protein
MNGVIEINVYYIIAILWIVGGFWNLLDIIYGEVNQIGYILVCLNLIVAGIIFLWGG